MLYNRPSVLGNWRRYCPNIRIFILDLSGRMHRQSSQHTSCADATLTGFAVHADLPVWLPARPGFRPCHGAVLTFIDETSEGFSFGMPYIREFIAYLIAK